MIIFVAILIFATPYTPGCKGLIVADITFPPAYFGDVAEKANTTEFEKANITLPPVYLENGEKALLHLNKGVEENYLTSHQVPFEGNGTDEETVGNKGFSEATVTSPSSENVGLVEMVRERGQYDPEVPNGTDKGVETLVTSNTKNRKSSSNDAGRFVGCILKFKKISDVADYDDGYVNRKTGPILESGRKSKRDITLQSDVRNSAFDALSGFASSFGTTFLGNQGKIDGNVGSASQLIQRGFGLARGRIEKGLDIASGAMDESADVKIGSLMGVAGDGGVKGAEAIRNIFGFRMGNKGYGENSVGYRKGSGSIGEEVGNGESSGVEQKFIGDVGYSGRGITNIGSNIENAGIKETENVNIFDDASNAEFSKNIQHISNVGVKGNGDSVKENGKDILDSTPVDNMNGFRRHSDINFEKDIRTADSSYRSDNSMVQENRMVNMNSETSNEFSKVHSRKISNTAVKNIEDIRKDKNIDFSSTMEKDITDSVREKFNEQFAEAVEDKKSIANKHGFKAGSIRNLGAEKEDDEFGIYKIGKVVSDNKDLKISSVKKNFKAVKESYESLNSQSEKVDIGSEVIKKEMKPIGENFRAGDAIKTDVVEDTGVIFRLNSKINEKNSTTITNGLKENREIFQDFSGTDIQHADTDNNAVAENRFSSSKVIVDDQTSFIENNARGVGAVERKNVAWHKGFDNDDINIAEVVGKGSEITGRNTIALNGGNAARFTGSMQAMNKDVTKIGVGVIGNTGGRINGNLGFDGGDVGRITGEIDEIHRGAVEIKGNLGGNIDGRMNDKLSGRSREAIRVTGVLPVPAFEINGGVNGNTGGEIGDNIGGGNIGSGMRSRFDAIGQSIASSDVLNSGVGGFSVSGRIFKRSIDADDKINTLESTAENGRMIDEDIVDGVVDLSVVYDKEMDKQVSLDNTFETISTVENFENENISQAAETTTKKPRIEGSNKMSIDNFMNIYTDFIKGNVMVLENIFNDIFSISGKILKYGIDAWNLFSSIYSSSKTFAVDNNDTKYHKKPLTNDDSKITLPQTTPETITSEEDFEKNGKSYPPKFSTENSMIEKTNTTDSNNFQKDGHLNSNSEKNVSDVMKLALNPNVNAIEVDDVFLSDSNHEILNLKSEKDHPDANAIKEALNASKKASEFVDIFLNGFDHGLLKSNSGKNFLDSDTMKKTLYPNEIVDTVRKFIIYAVSNSNAENDHSDSVAMKRTLNPKEKAAEIVDTFLSEFDHEVLKSNSEKHLSDFNTTKGSLNPTPIEDSLEHVDTVTSIFDHKLFDSSSSEDILDSGVMQETVNQGEGFSEIFDTFPSHNLVSQFNLIKSSSPLSYSINDEETDLNSENPLNYVEPISAKYDSKHLITRISNRPD